MPEKNNVNLGVGSRLSCQHGIEMVNPVSFPSRNLENALGKGRFLMIFAGNTSKHFGNSLLQAVSLPKLRSDRILNGGFSDWTGLDVDSDGKSGPPMFEVLLGQQDLGVSPWRTMSYCYSGSSFSASWARGMHNNMTSKLYPPGN